MNNLSTTLTDEAFLVLEYYEWQSTLSEIPGIPKYSYQVINSDSIFVLRKLVEEVRKYMSSMFDPQLNDLAIKLLPSAHLSPLKAIEYGVIPEEFKVLKHDKGFVIQHKILRAFIPGVFSTMQQVNEVLARLLIGNIQAGEGNCFYKLQPMILQEEFETKFQKLLSKPIIESTTTDYTQYFSPILANIQFEEGFSGISSNVFTSIQSIEDSWVLDANKAVNIVFQEKKKLFQIIAQLSLSTLSNWKAEELEFDSEYIAELRNCYPELNKLTDQLLIDLFDEYQAFVNHGDLWDASREEEFFFYGLELWVKLHPTSSFFRRNFHSCRIPHYLRNKKCL